jgi:CheY-like chemotaxis protein
VGFGRILVVEDPLVRRLIDGILTRGGYTVVEAEPRRALELLEDETGNIALLITNAPELFLDCAQEVALLYVASFPEPQWVERFSRCRTLHKPFPPQKLLVLTRELLESSGGNGTRAVAPNSGAAF